VLDVLLSVVAIYKGKPLVGVIGIFVPLVSLAGTVRLAAPDSRWARRRYGIEGEPEKLERARERWERIAERRRRIADAVAGAPHSAGVRDPAAPDPAGVRDPGGAPEPERRSGRDPVHRA
jgi:hypothetical protein